MCLALSVPLWRSAARLEEQAGATAKARALLEQGRLKNAASPELWLAAMRTEQRAGLTKAAEALMAKALQVRTDPRTSLNAFVWTLGFTIRALPWHA